MARPEPEGSRRSGRSSPTTNHRRHENLVAMNKFRPVDVAGEAEGAWVYRRSEAREGDASTTARRRPLATSLRLFSVDEQPWCAQGRGCAPEHRGSASLMSGRCPGSRVSMRRAATLRPARATGPRGCIGKIACLKKLQTTREKNIHLGHDEHDEAERSPIRTTGVCSPEFDISSTIGPPAEHHIGHADEARQEQPGRARRLHPQHRAEQHHKGADRADKWPDRWGQDMVIVVLFVRHVRFLLVGPCGGVQFAAGAPGAARSGVRAACWSAADCADS